MNACEVICITLLHGVLNEPIVDKPPRAKFDASQLHD